MGKPATGLGGVIAIGIAIVAEGTAISIACLGWCAPALASPPTEETEVQVHQMNPDMDVTQLARPGVKIHLQEAANGSPSPSPVRRSAAPPPAQTRKLLEESGLTASVEGWDHAAKDMLYIKAKQYPLERLRAEYPKLDQARLERFWELIHKPAPKSAPDHTEEQPEGRP